VLDNLLLRTKHGFTWVDTLVFNTTEYGMLKSHIHCIKIICICQTGFQSAECWERIVGPFFFVETGGGGVIFRIFYDYTFLWHFYCCQNKNKNSISLWKYCDTLYTVHLGGGAEKSLARPTSWCRRTESILSLERGVCSCAELQVFSCYRGWKEARQATRAI